MVGIGASYKDECNNGAAHYLYIAGIIIIVCNLLGSLLICFKTFAEKDGKISCVESCGICILTLTNTCLLISSLVILSGVLSWFLVRTETGRMKQKIDCQKTIVTKLRS